MIPGFFPIAKGGAETFALNLCKNLVIKGHKVQIITRNLDLQREENLQGIKIWRFTNILPYKIKFYGFGRFVKSKYLRILVAFFDFLCTIPTLWRLHRKNQFHVIHTSFILPFGLSGLIMKKFLRIPLVITVHGPADFYEVPRLFNPILRFILKRADTVVAVSLKLKEDLINRLGNLQLKVIRNGIPLRPYESTGKSVQLDKYKIATDDFMILTAGRLVRRKNLDILIRAVPAILEKISNCKIIVLGSGIEKNKLQMLINRLNLSSSIIMPGWVSEEEKVRLFKRADIFIQLSQLEGLSLALLESKAAGIPAIVIGSGSPFDPVSHEETGLLIYPPILLEKIVHNIEYFYQNVVLRRKIGENVKKEAKNLFSLQKMVENYIKIYQKVLKKK